MSLPTAQIQSPFIAKVGISRNPANKNAGKFVTLDDFLKFSKEKAVTGVLVNIQAYAPFFINAPLTYSKHHH